MHVRNLADHVILLKVDLTLIEPTEGLAEHVCGTPDFLELVFATRPEQLRGP